MFVDGISPYTSCTIKIQSNCRNSIGEIVSGMSEKVRVRTLIPLYSALLLDEMTEKRGEPEKKIHTNIYVKAICNKFALRGC